MHMAMKELRDLANCYLQGQLPDASQVKRKRHMGECDLCYARFCTEYLILMAFQKAGLLAGEIRDTRASVSMLSLLTIRLIEDHLRISCERATVDGLSWEFIRVPQTAAVRGEQEQPEFEYFVNRISEFSCIKREGNKVRIQLDGDIFPVDRLKVCVTTDEMRRFYEFQYEEALECYTVVLDDAMLTEDSVIEIVEVCYE